MKIEFRFIFSYIKKEYKILIISLFFLILLSIISLIPPYIMKLIVDKTIINKNINMLLVYSAIGLILYLFISLFDYLSNYYFTLFSEKTILNIKNDLINLLC